MSIREVKINVVRATHMLIRTISEIARANNALCFSNAVSS